MTSCNCVLNIFLGYACLNTILRNKKPASEAVFCSRTCRWVYYYSTSPSSHWPPQPRLPSQKRDGVGQKSWTKKCWRFISHHRVERKQRKFIHHCSISETIEASFRISDFSEFHQNYFPSLHTLFMDTLSTTAPMNSLEQGLLRRNMVIDSQLIQVNSLN